MSSKSSCSLDTVGLWPLPVERSFQGLCFLGNGWCPGFRQTPTSFPGHSQGAGLRP